MRVAQTESQSPEEVTTSTEPRLCPSFCISRKVVAKASLELTLTILHHRRRRSRGPRSATGHSGGGRWAWGAEGAAGGEWRREKGRQMTRLRDPRCDFEFKRGRKPQAGAGKEGPYRGGILRSWRWPVDDISIGHQNLTGSTHKVIEELKLTDAVILNDGPRYSENDKAVSRISAVHLINRFPLIVNLTVAERFILTKWRDSHPLYC